MNLNTEPQPIDSEAAKMEGFVEVFGSHIHYEKRGQGLPVILIDGWLGATKAFDGVVPNLSKNNQCIAIDYPGFGVSSEFVGKRHTLKNYGDAFFGVMDKLGIDKAGIVGDSMGTHVALEMADKHPDRVSFLVLQGAPSFPEKAAKIVAKLDRNIVGKLADDIFKFSLATEAFRWVNPEFKGLTLREREAAGARLKRTSGHAAIESLKDMVAFDLAQAVSRVNVPVLMVEGELAAKTPFSAGSIIRKNVKEGLLTEVIVPRGTHTILLKNPQEFTDAVSGFRKKLEGV